MGVVLGDVSHAGETVQGPGELVSVQRRRFGVANRQLAVRVQTVVEEEHVPGAIHRLDAVRPVLLWNEEHVLPVLVPMP